MGPLSASETAADPRQLWGRTLSNVHLNLDDKRRVILWPEEGGDPRAVRPQQQEPEC